jgi:hypothetical protein
MPAEGHAVYFTQRMPVYALMRHIRRRCFRSAAAAFDERRCFRFSPAFRYHGRFSSAFDIYFCRHFDIVIFAISLTLIILLSFSPLRSA